MSGACGAREDGGLPRVRRAADAKVQDLAKSILDRVLSASIKEAVQAFSAVVTPYLTVLSQVRSYY